MIVPFHCGTNQRTVLFVFNRKSLFVLSQMTKIIGRLTDSLSFRPIFWTFIYNEFEVEKEGSLMGINIHGKDNKNWCSHKNLFLSDYLLKALSNIWFNMQPMDSISFCYSGRSRIIPPSIHPSKSPHLSNRIIFRWKFEYQINLIATTFLVLLLFLEKRVLLELENQNFQTLIHCVRLIYKLNYESIF